MQRLAVDTVLAHRQSLAPAELEELCRRRGQCRVFVLSDLPGDEDGLVRRVPLLVAVGSDLQPGLALEASRLAARHSRYRNLGLG